MLIQNPKSKIKNRFALLACVALVFLCGCDEEDEDPYARTGALQKLSDFNKLNKKDANNPDANLTPEELHAKVVKQMKENEARAQKLRDEAAKKNKKPDEKPKAKDKDDERPGNLGVYGRKAPMALDNGLDEDGDKKKEDRKRGTAPTKVENSPRTSQQLAELKGPIQHTRPLGDAATGMSENGERKEFKIGDQKPKSDRGFFQRLFGGKKEAPPTLGSSKDGETAKLLNGAFPKKPGQDVSNYVPSNPDRKDSVLSRVAAEKARLRLQSEFDAAAAAGGGQIVPGNDDNKAEVVELGTTPTPAPDAAGKIAPLAGETVALPEPKKDESAPPSEADIKDAAEKQYREGLASRDVVAREGAYERAAMERREDALPFLINEVDANNLLAAYAAQCIAAIGKLTPEAEAVLIKHLANPEYTVRIACADTLGRLRSRKALLPITEALKTDKHYQVRSTYCSALGMIGDRAAITVLKAKLEDNGEIEFVKASAALALARLGDPSGRAHLIRTLDSRMPAMQVIGLTGIVQLNDPETAGFLSSALESQYDEVWTTAVYLFPRLGPGVALPILRARLETGSETLRRRAAIGMGFSGSDDGLPYIDRAVRDGSLQERAMGCELLGNLGRTDRVPLLIEALQDRHTSVRTCAAVSLTRLNAVEALPALMDAARGVRGSQELPPALRPAQPEMYERLIMLSCVRILRGEKDDLIISTLPNKHDNSWPEVDRVLTEQQVELVKLYTLVDVITANNQPIGAIIKLPNGKEVMFQEGETVAAGFKVRDIGAAMNAKDKQRMPASVTLKRGDETIRLIEGGSAEVDTAPRKK